MARHLCARFLQLLTVSCIMATHGWPQILCGQFFLFYNWVHPLGVLTMMLVISPRLPYRFLLCSALCYLDVWLQIVCSQFFFFCDLAEMH